MPLYKITTPEGLLTSESKATLAAEITEFHSQMSGLDKDYTKIVFESFSQGDGFIGGEVGPAVILTVKVRAGRPTIGRSCCSGSSRGFRTRPARQMFTCC